MSALESFACRSCLGPAPMRAAWEALLLSLREDASLAERMASHLRTETSQRSFAALLARLQPSLPRSLRAPAQEATGAPRSQRRL